MSHKEASIVVFTRRGVIQLGVGLSGRLIKIVLSPEASAELRESLWEAEVASRVALTKKKAS